MIVAIHQPNFLPGLAYFHKMAHADLFVFLDDVQYSKGSYTNRTKIKTPNGVKWLTVPVDIKGKGPLKITQVMLRVPFKDWICGLYARMIYYYFDAPCMKEYGITAMLNTIKARKVEAVMEELGYSMDLSLFNQISMDKCISDLAITTKLILASDLDYDRKAKKTLKLVSILKEVGADTYLSGLGARAYNDDQVFADNGIKLVYDNFEHPVYPQLHGEFVPGLSIIDLLFNCGPESRRILEGGLDQKENLKRFGAQPGVLIEYPQK